MESTPNSQVYADRKVWFSMWFLGAVVTFGLAFFPMFYRLVDGRNKHLMHQVELEAKVAAHNKSKSNQSLTVGKHFKPMNAKLWAVSIILIIPAFVIMYILTRDLAAHEHQEDAFLVSALPERVFMTQTIPQTTYLLITIVTLGVGGVYWLYKLVNLYNAHYKADLQVEKEITRHLEEQNVVEHM